VWRSEGREVCIIGKSFIFCFVEICISEKLFNNYIIEIDVFCEEILFMVFLKLSG